MKGWQAGTLLRDFAFRPGLEFGINGEWHEHQSEAGGCGTHIRSLVFDRNPQCAGFSVIRRRA
jgi:hypothetical protein